MVKEYVGGFRSAICAVAVRVIVGPVAYADLSQGLRSAVDASVDGMYPEIWNRTAAFEEARFTPEARQAIASQMHAALKDAAKKADFQVQQVG